MQVILLFLVSWWAHQESIQTKEIQVNSLPMIIVGQGPATVEVDGHLALVGPTAVTASFFSLPPDPSLLGYVPQDWMEKEGSSQETSSVSWGNTKPQKAQAVTYPDRFLVVPLLHRPGKATISVRGEWRLAILPQEPLDLQVRTLRIQFHKGTKVTEQSPTLPGDSFPRPPDLRQPWPWITTETRRGVIYWPITTQAPLPGPAHQPSGVEIKKR